MTRALIPMLRVAADFTTRRQGGDTLEGASLLAVVHEMRDFVVSS